MSIVWQTKKLGEICDVFTDGDWIESKDQSENGIRLIQTGNIGEGIFKDRGDKARFITVGTFKRLRCTEIFEGDCLVSRLPDPVGRSCIIPYLEDKLITAVDCTIIRFNPNFAIPKYFNYYSQSAKYLNDIERETTGTTRKRISRSKLAEICLPLPPLSEQKRIVAILDEAFSGITRAKEIAEKNLANAKEIFNSYLQAVAAERKPLGELVNITTGKLDANAAVENGKYPFFTCSREIFAIDKHAFDCEAILLAGNNAVGDFNVKHYKGKFNAYQRTYVLTAKDERMIHYRHLYYQMLNSLKEFKEKSVGAGTKFLKLGMIQDLQIALPPIKEQNALVAILDELLEKTQSLESIYRQKLSNVEELKKALLHKAFSGGF